MPVSDKPTPTPASPSTPEAWAGEVALAKLPLSLRKLLRALPEREWYRIRAFVVESVEVGELVDVIPQANRAMETCPGRMIHRIRAKEITGQQVDEVYNGLHDAIHGVRQAVQRIFRLAGLQPTRLKAPRDGPASEEGAGEEEPEPLVPRTP